MRKRVLGELIHDAQQRAEEPARMLEERTVEKGATCAPVSQDERFAEPAEGLSRPWTSLNRYSESTGTNMSDGEEVEEAAEEVVDGEVAILAVVLCNAFFTANIEGKRSTHFLLDGFAERDVEEAHDCVSCPARRAGERKSVNAHSLAKSFDWK